MVSVTFLIKVLDVRTPPFFPLNRGKNHSWKYFLDSACGAICWIIIYKQQFLHSDWLKTCQLIPNQWNFTSATLNHIRFVSTTIPKITIINITKEISVKICWQLKTPTRTWKCTCCIMQMSYLYASDFPFKNVCNRSTTKKIFGKRVMTSMRVQTTINHISICFSPQYQRQR